MEKYKQVLSLLMVCCIMIGLLPVSAAAASANSAEGFIAPVETPDASAVRISTAEDLASIANDLTGSYVLINDIDLSDYGTWTPIGTTLSNAFKGKFDGQGYKITGLTVSSVFTSATISPVPPYAVGLFGVCDGAQIKNVFLEDISVTVDNSSGYLYETTKIDGGNVYAGSIAGYARNSAIIYNCHSSGSIQASGSGEASASTHAGGIVGYAENAAISYCYNQCTVDTSYQSLLSGYPSYAGGLVGYCSGDGAIDRSYNSGAVTATVGNYTDAFCGGLIGDCSTSAVTITDCFNEGAITAETGVGSSSLFGGDTAYAGGIVASFAGIIERVYNAGAVNAKVTDTYDLGSGSAYAGGICGSSASGAKINDAASIHSTVYAVEGGGTKYQYRISYSGTKNNTVTNSTMTSGSTNDADAAVSEENLKTADVYQNTLGWDFSTVWEIVSGKDFPQLKQVDIESQEYTDEYIDQHLNFINGTTYKNLLTNYRWAQIYWSEENNFKSNAGEALYRVIDGVIDIATLEFGELFEDGNPYKILILDYISDQTVQDNLTNEYKDALEFEVNAKIKDVTSFLKLHWNDAWEELSEEDIFWLFYYDEKPAEEWITSNFEEHLSEIVQDVTEDQIAGLFETTVETADKLMETVEVAGSAAEWLGKLSMYSANVSAYASVDQEFKTMLAKIAENIPDDGSDQQDQLTKAIEAYTTYGDDTDVSDDLFQMFTNYLQGEGIEQIIIDVSEKGVEKLVEKVFSATVRSKLQVIGWAADATWNICEYVTKNGELMDCRQMLRANAYFETAVYATLKEYESTFLTTPSMETALAFNTAFNFFKEVQIYSMDTCIAYFDTYQTALLPAIHNLSNTFMNSAIEEVMINKLFLYKTYCHGTSYELGGKIITIACPTDVELYDANSNIAVQIVGDEVISCVSGIFASSISGVKVIAVPAGQDYTIRISATDEGSMDYIVSEYSADMENIQNVVYSDIALSKSLSFSGAINGVLETEASSYDLTSSDSQVIDEREVTTENSVVPVNQVSVEVNEVEMTINETLFLSASIFPDNATVKSIIWMSSNTNIATVSEDGKVTALRSGTAEIYAQAVYGGVSGVCSVTVQPASTNATGVALDKTSVTLTSVGAAESLTATISPSNATNKSVSWTSSSPGVATVSDTGVVTAVANGQTIITVTTADGGFTAQCTVTVDMPPASVPVTDVSVAPVSATLAAVGETESLTATISPSNATNKSVSWTSSSPGVATVSDTGVVTAVANGQTIITVTSADGGYSNTCVITVKIPQNPNTGNNEGGSGNYGGGDSNYPAYSITTPNIPNGKVTISPKTASKDEVVTISIAPDKGYELDTLTATDMNGKEVDLNDKGDGKYTFIMPSGKITIDASFRLIPETEVQANPFTDVAESAYYFDAVLWAVENGITSGTGDGTTFSPNAACTRAQMATFLWRAAGSPEPTGGANPFVDVLTDTYYAKAVQWAYEQGITSGTSTTTFGPDDPCTRGQMATFLWRNAGSPVPTGDTNPFTDTLAGIYYTSAVQWAAENGITKGTGDGTTFSPDNDCTRGQMVTFLYRRFGEQQ